MRPRKSDDELRRNRSEYIRSITVKFDIRKPEEKAALDALTRKEKEFGRREIITDALNFAAGHKPDMFTRTDKQTEYLLSRIDDMLSTKMNRMLRDLKTRGVDLSPVANGHNLDTDDGLSQVAKGLASALLSRSDSLVDGFDDDWNDDE